MKFQACVNASQSKCHLKDAENNTRPQLTLCRQTAVAFNYKAKLYMGRICKACLAVYVENGGALPPTAETLGVTELLCD